jgi:hypothetical protein
VVPAELQHPRLLRGGCSKKRDEVEIAAKQIATAGRTPAMAAGCTRTASTKLRRRPALPALRRPRWALATARPTLRSIRFEVVISLPNLVHLLKRDEDSCELVQAR